MQVRSLGREDPLETEMAAHSSVLARGIPWTEEPGRLQSMGLHGVGHDYRAEQHLEFTMHVLRSYWVVLSTQEIGSDLYLKSYFL